jgi:hypothetical protein
MDQGSRATFVRSVCRLSCSSFLVDFPNVQERSQIDFLIFLVVIMVCRMCCPGHYPCNLVLDLCQAPDTRTTLHAIRALAEVLNQGGSSLFVAEIIRTMMTVILIEPSLQEEALQGVIIVYVSLRAHFLSFLPSVRSSPDVFATLIESHETRKPLPADLSQLLAEPTVRIMSIGSQQIVNQILILWLKPVRL